MEISWRIELFGGLRAQRFSTGQGDEQGASSLEVLDHFRSRREGALLAFLAYSPRPHTREALTDLLWPEHDPERGRNHLRVMLCSLRHMLVV